MFTGLITAIGEVRHAEPIGAAQDMRLTIATPPGFLQAHGVAQVGASIACSGCCLTATALGPDWFTVEVSAETLARTALHGWGPGTRLNLERSLRLGDELGGHLVSGHVDGIGRVVARHPENASLRIEIAAPAPLHRYIAEKGSVAVDGVSLTVNSVSFVPAGAPAGTPAGGPADAATHRFGVNIIPHTAAHTTLGLLAQGDPVHIEIDMLARYVARLQETA